jgi:hypothetical protein
LTERITKPLFVVLLLLQELLRQQVDATGWFSTAQNSSSIHAEQGSRGCDNAGSSVSTSSSGRSGSGGSGRSNQAMVFGVSNMPQWLQQLAQQLPLQQCWPAEVSWPGI